MNLTGKFPGVDYELGEHPKGTCLLCRRSNLPLLLTGSDANLSIGNLGICEYCSTAASLAFRRAAGETLPGTPVYEFEDVTASLCLIVRKLSGEWDKTIPQPMEVLMVSRKDEPGSWGLPGGKRNPGEPAEETAVRELFEETGCTSWRSALDLIYTGLSPRGRFVSVYLARGYSGEPVKKEEGVEVAWKLWPARLHAGSLGSYYLGVEMAFEMRKRIHELESTVDFICTRVRAHVTEHIRIALGTDDGLTQEDRMALMKAQIMIMTEDERILVKLALDREKKRNEIVEIKTTQRKVETRVVRPRTALPPQADTEIETELFGESHTPGEESEGFARRKI